MAASVSASLDRDTISVGETASLSLTIADDTPADVPAIPEVSNLVFRASGRSSQFSIVNGRSTSALIYTYLVQALQPGDYVIPAIPAEVDGRRLASQPLKLKVLKRGETTPATRLGDQGASLKLIVPKTEVFIGETLPVEIRLYAVQGKLKQPPQLDQEGFTIGKMVQQQQSRMMVANRPYNVLPYRTYVVPVKTGALPLGPASMPLLVPRPGPPRSFIFDDLFDWVDVTLSSDPVVIQVLPLPTNNVPPDFNGAVGRYTFSARVSTNTVTAGDPITLTLQITGQGPLESISLPAPTGWRDFKTYPPLSKVETTDEFGLAGTKTFEQVIIPETADVRAIPALTFSFFDPEKRTYQTLSRAAIPITVRPAAAPVAQPTVVAGTRAAPGTPSISTNIVHIKSRPGVLAQIQSPLLQRPWFILLQAVPLTAWLAALAWRHRQTTLANNPRLRRRREVARRIQDGLDELQRLAAANQPEAFFALVFRLLQEQLGERLDLPASAITEAVVDERLRPAGVPEQSLALLRGLFQSCNQARYAPLRTGQELASLTSDLRTALRLLQQVDVSHGR